MRARGWVIAGVLGCAVAAPALAEPKDPKPLATDIKPFKDKLLVLKDANGGTYVALPRGEGTVDQRVWYGTGKMLFCGGVRNTEKLLLRPGMMVEVDIAVRND